MTAYFIADIEIRDPDTYANYLRAAMPTLEQHGGRVLVRADEYEHLEGDWTPHRVVIVEFPSMAQARAWWNGPEYDATKALRRASTVSHALIVEGL